MESNANRKQTQEELLDIYPKAVSIYELTIPGVKSTKVIFKAIRHNWDRFNGLVLRNGVEYDALKDSIFRKYLIPDADAITRRFVHGLAGIATALQVSVNSIIYISERCGILQSCKLKYTNLYDLQELLQTNEIQSLLAGHQFNHINYKLYFTAELVDWKERWMKKISSVHPKITWNGTVCNDSQVDQTNLEKRSQAFDTLFFKLVAHRAGAECLFVKMVPDRRNENILKERPFDGKISFLSDSDWSKIATYIESGSVDTFVDPLGNSKYRKFDLFQLDKDDWESWFKGLSSGSIVNSPIGIPLIRSFMGFVLSEEKERIQTALEHYDTLDPDQELQLRRREGALTSYGTRLFKWFDGFVKPRIESDSKKKAFLTPEEVVLCYQAIRKAFGSRSAVTFLCQFALNLRSMETSRLAVEDFLHDEHTGYLKLDNLGVGRMYFPAAKSKGGYGPSHNEGTPISKHVVAIINEYLANERFVQCPFERHSEMSGFVFRGKNGERRDYSRGHGFLLLKRRKKNSGPNDGITSQSVLAIIRDTRGVLDFLPSSKREVLSSHDGRHTNSELIETAYHLPDQLQRHLSEASNMMLRHGMNRYVAYRNTQKGGFILTDEQLVQICLMTVFFPFNLEELAIWRREVGIDKETDQEMRESLQKSGEVAVTGTSTLQASTDLAEAHAATLQAVKNELQQVNDMIDYKKKTQTFAPGEFLKLLGRQKKLAEDIKRFEGLVGGGTIDAISI